MQLTNDTPQIQSPSHAATFDWAKLLSKMYPTVALEMASLYFCHNSEVHHEHLHLANLQHSPRSAPCVVAAARWRVAALG